MKASADYYINETEEPPKYEMMVPLVSLLKMTILCTFWVPLLMEIPIYIYIYIYVEATSIQASSCATSTLWVTFRPKGAIGYADGTLTAMVEKGEARVF